MIFVIFLLWENSTECLWKRFQAQLMLEHELYACSCTAKVRATPENFVANFFLLTCDILKVFFVVVVQELLKLHSLSDGITYKHLLRVLPLVFKFLIVHARIQIILGIVILKA